MATKGRSNLEDSAEWPTSGSLNWGFGSILWFAWETTANTEFAKLEEAPEQFRAQRSKKFDLDRNFQSRSKFLVSLENFNLDVSISPKKIGPRWVARSKISFSIEIFNIDRNLEFFLIFGPSGNSLIERGTDPHPQDFSLTKKTARFTKGQFRPY